MSLLPSEINLKNIYPKQDPCLSQLKAHLSRSHLPETIDRVIAILGELLKHRFENENWLSLPHFFLVTSVSIYLVG